jgi:hypothetical protein
VPADAIARRFPLVSRAKPAGRALTARIASLRATLREPDRTDRYTQVARASEVFNVAALIASDCGMPDLARSLCWQQYDIFDAARPLPAPIAKLALQPVLNIARQMIRDSDGEAAHAMLVDLYQAARSRSTITVAGRNINLADITVLPEDHKTICTQLWGAILADGTRGLVQAGRWTQAAEVVAAHRGVGDRLLDGRQVTIMSLLQRGHRDQAIAMVDESTITEQWEKPVAAMLRAYCLREDASAGRKDLDAAAIEALALVGQVEPSTAVFRTRVALTVLDLAEPYMDLDRSRLTRAIVRQASTDAYVAKESLGSTALRASITAQDQRKLADLVESSGLGRGAIPANLLDELTASVYAATDELRLLLPAYGSSLRARTAPLATNLLEVPEGTDTLHE